MSLNDAIDDYRTNLTIYYSLKNVFQFLHTVIKTRIFSLSDEILNSVFDLVTSNALGQLNEVTLVDQLRVRYLVRHLIRYFRDFDSCECVYTGCVYYPLVNLNIGTFFSIVHNLPSEKGDLSFVEYSCLSIFQSIEEEKEPHKDDIKMVMIYIHLSIIEYDCFSLMELIPIAGVPQGSMLKFYSYVIEPFGRNIQLLLKYKKISSDIKSGTTPKDMCILDAFTEDYHNPKENELVFRNDRRSPTVTDFLSSIVYEENSTRTRVMNFREYLSVWQVTSCF